MSEAARLFRDMSRMSYGVQRALLEQLARSADYIDSLPRCLRCRRILSEGDAGPGAYDTATGRTVAMCASCARVETN